MAKAARQVIHQIRWDAEEWERIVDAAVVLSERDHLDLNPTDIIRKGTRQLVEDVLTERPAQKAS